MSDRILKWKLCFEAYFALILTLAIGALVSAPILYGQIRSVHETYYSVQAFPTDDEALRKWGQAQPKVISFVPERGDRELRIRSEAWSPVECPSLSNVAAKLRELGYGFRGMRGGSSERVTNLPGLLTNAQFLAVMLAATQVAFAGAGWFFLWRAARRGKPLPPFFAGNHGRAVALGLVSGVGLIGIGQLYGFLLPKLLGKPLPSFWDSTASLPEEAKLVLLLFGALGAPITEEIFFRGYLFGKFQVTGFVGLGAVVSSALFAGAHFSDPYNVPAIFVVGLFFAWLYRRTRSLLAPMVAHAVNNAVGIVWLIFS